MIKLIIKVSKIFEINFYTSLPSHFYISISQSAVEPFSAQSKLYLVSGVSTTHAQAFGLLYLEAALPEPHPGEKIRELLAYVQGHLSVAYELL